MLYKRHLLSRIQKVLPREEFIIFTGARQCGKTSLLILIKEILEQQGKRCHYLNLENPEYITLLNHHPFNIFDIVPETKAKQYLFIDEIQYLKDPSNFLKLLYDEKREKLKIVASGSSAFYIDQRFKDSLAGRKFLFEMYTLNFSEFLHFQGEERLLKKEKRIKNGKGLTLPEQRKAHALWQNYIRFGGYPKVVLAEDDEIKKILLEEIATSYIKKDVLDAGVRNSDVYFSLLKLLAEQIGSLVNVGELSSSLGISRKTVEDYLWFMQKSYHVAFLKPFHNNIRKELTKMPKVYFYDIGLRNTILKNFSPLPHRLDKGHYLENIAFREFLFQTNNFDALRFWRTQDKKEIDFIINGSEAFEIKYDSKRLKKRQLSFFTDAYPDISVQVLDHDRMMQYFYIR